jgi:hypothetical protein
MTMSANLQGVIELLQGDDEFIKEIVQTAENASGKLDQLSQKLDVIREDADELISMASTTKFAVAKGPDVKVHQKKLLDKIEQVSKDIQELSEFPQITRHLYAERTQLYLLLAGTYNKAARKVVPFTDQEAEDLRVLLRRSVLDAASRQKKAHILDAAVQISKLAFRVASKVALA